MKRLSIALSLLAAFLLGQSSEAAAPSRLFFPVVANGQAALTIVTLIESDSSFVGVTGEPSTCRVFLSYIDRAHGNRLHLVEDIGDRVVEVMPPLLSVTTPGPPEPRPFTAPGDKQADGAPLVICGQLRLYYTSRDEGDPTGPFKLKRIIMAIP